MKGAEDPRPSARQTYRFRDQRPDRKTFQTDGPLGPAHRHQTPQLCLGHNTHAAGVTGLDPPLRSIRRQHCSWHWVWWDCTPISSMTTSTLPSIIFLTMEPPPISRQLNLFASWIMFWRTACLNLMGSCSNKRLEQLWAHTWHLFNLFMAWLEEAMMAARPVLIPREFWRRFLDVIFLLWTNTRHELEDFLHINSFHPSIKFTVNFSPVNLPFLDINIILIDGYLHTDLHTKATDAHAYLHRRSCHPPHVYKNIPSSQFLRMRQLCSDLETFENRSQEIEASLLSRDYDIKSPKQASETLTHKNKLGHKRPSMVVTHNPCNPTLEQWVAELQRDVINPNDRIREGAASLSLCVPFSPPLFLSQTTMCYCWY